LVVKIKEERGVPRRGPLFAIATAAAPTAPTAPTATTTLLGKWLKTAEVRDREMKPD
jgi:hypothetical protein